MMEMIQVPDAPNAIGPYCHAMKAGNLVFCSGQTPLDPGTMTLVGTTIEEQTQRVLENVSGTQAQPYNRCSKTKSFGCFGRNRMHCCATIKRA